jgi:uncharacterized protein (DUF2345 family)
MLDSDKNDISIKSNGSINIAAGEKLSLSGDIVEITGKTKIDILSNQDDAGMITIDAKSTIGLNGREGITLDSPDIRANAKEKLDLNCIGPTTITGAMVKIN